MQLSATASCVIVCGRRTAVRHFSSSVRAMVAACLVTGTSACLTPSCTNLATTWCPSCQDETYGECATAPATCNTVGRRAFKGTGLDSFTIPYSSNALALNTMSFDSVTATFYMQCDSGGGGGSCSGSGAANQCQGCNVRVLTFGSNWDKSATISWGPSIAAAVSVSPPPPSPPPPSPPPPSPSSPSPPSPSTTPSPPPPSLRDQFRPPVQSELRSLAKSSLMPSE